MRTLCLLIFLTLLTLAPAQAEITGVVVVRHAEKADDGTRDPALTLAGRERARALADSLARATIGGLIASQYRRTQQTLAVLAEQRDLDVTIVPAESGNIEAHVDAIAAKVRESEAEGLLVIAGHSNTVPMIVETLTGRAVSPMNESEYDRFYMLLVRASGMEIVTARYGAPSDGNGESVP